MAGKVKINAVLDSEIENLLKGSRYYEAFINNKYRCEVCGITINIDNVGIIFPIQNEEEIDIGFICDNYDCIEEYSN